MITIDNNLLGAWKPTSISLKVNGIRYDGYPINYTKFQLMLEWRMILKKQGILQ